MSPAKERASAAARLAMNRMGLNPMSTPGYRDHYATLASMFERIEDDEREACAALASSMRTRAASQIAAGIRARGAE